MTYLVIEAALRALLLAAAVGLGLTVLRVRHVPTRKAAWSLVLLASLAMPLLMRWPAGFAQRFAWVVPVPQVTKTAPKKQTAPVPAILTVSHAMKSDEGAVAQGPRAMTRASAAPVVDGTQDRFSGAAPKSFHWPSPLTLALWAYLTVGGALLLRLIWGLLAALHLWATAEQVSPLVAPEGFVRAHRRIASPVTIGSGVVLPANYRQWTPRKRRMVLAHELSHVRQLDFYLQLLAGLYTAVFWFSPLGWMVRRLLASLGEQMADRAGIEAGQSRTGYAELVLEFAAMPRTNLQGVAMARPGNLTQRIETMLNERVFRSAFVEGRRRGLVALMLIPMALFAVTALVRVPVAAATTTECERAVAAECLPPASDLHVREMPPVTSIAPRARLALVAAVQPVAGWERMQNPAPQANAAPTARPSPAAAPQAAEAPAARPQSDAGGAGTEASGVSRQHDSWAVLDGSEARSEFAGDWNAATRKQMETARRIAHGPALWFSHDGRSWIIDDPATIGRIEKLYAPMKELGIEQQALAEQQKKLGEKMRALAEQQRSTMQVKMPDLSGEMAKVNAAVASLKIDQRSWNTEALANVQAELQAKQGQMISPEQVARIQESVARVQAELTSEKMAELQARLAQMQGRLGALNATMGSEQRDFGAKMGALGAEQGKLGVQQGRLGAEQGSLATQAERAVQRMIQEALRNGQARPVQ